MSDFWSWFIIIIVAINIIGMAWLLYATRKAGHNHSDDNKMHHQYDGIEEYNNPLPRWWLGLFYITILFSLAYLWFYPGLGKYEGQWRWSQAQQWQLELKQAEQHYLPMYERYAAQPIIEVANDPKAVKMGQHIFANECFGCHGSDAGGLPGYPNLRDKDWLYGGSPEKIKESILQGRMGVMPALQTVLGEQGVEQVAHYVLSLSQREHETTKASAGEKIFNTQCFACHGTNGLGNPLLGAPNLTDPIWLYGGRLKQIKESIAKGRKGIMPPHLERLGEAKAHVVAAYIYSLSRNSEQTETQVLGISQ